MQPVTFETPDIAREEIAKITSLVLTARRLLAGGTMIDLVALQERVQSVCLSIERMEKTPAQSLLPDVQELVERLNKLEEDLREHLGRVTDPASEPSGRSGY